ncbi:hypothetical protein [Saccharopolyspora sp. NPDC002376]
MLGLLTGTRYLAPQGASPQQLRLARRLLLFASLVTLALNVAEPLCNGQLGKAAFDAVGPLLLSGWAEVGPGLLQAVAVAGPLSNGEEVSPAGTAADAGSTISAVFCTARDKVLGQKGACDDEAEPFQEEGPTERTPRNNIPGHGDGTDASACGPQDRAGPDPLFGRACALDSEHWANHHRPVSAETLRQHLGIGSARARALTRHVRRRHKFVETASVEQ